jgi:hypothetical protein
VARGSNYVKPATAAAVVVVADAAANSMKRWTEEE